MQVTLDDLVARRHDDAGRGLVPAAAVRARRLDRGRRCAGCRARRRWCGPCAPRSTEHEAIGTFETEYELHLHELGRHTRSSIAWEARPGSGERGPDGRQAGEFTLDEALVDSFRFNLSRQIVGEVRGQEIWAMIKAMESGTGSISTTHAADAEAADPQAGHLRDGGRARTSPTTRDEQLAATIDLDRPAAPGDQPAADGGRPARPLGLRDHRLAPGEREKGYADHARLPRRRRAACADPDVLPDEYRDLAAAWLRPRRPTSPPAAEARP